MHHDNLTLFRESLARVTAHAGFFDSFYDHFMAQSEEIAVIFVRRDMAQLKQKLQETLQILADTVEGRPGFGLYVEMLGRIHQRLNINRLHFEMWRDALVDTVEVFDEQYSSQIRRAWLGEIDSVINLLFDHLGSPRQAVS
jgi:hemoglobin-like flavoprotein